MSIETQHSVNDVASTSTKSEPECIVTCTTGFPEPRPLRVKSILKQSRDSPVISASRKGLEWSDSHGLNLHEIREYTVSEKEEDCFEEKSSSRRSSCCLLVLINLSDHFTRVSSNSNAPNTVVFGCLLGLQSGRVVDISNSFEVICNLSGFDWDFTHTRLEQYKTVFPYLDLVGWYTVGNVQLDEQHMIIQRKMMEMTESPLLLMLNPVMDQLKKELPVKLYETEVHVIDGVPSFIFVEAKFSIATAEAERIGVEQVAKSAMTSQDRDTGQFLAHLGGIYSAVKMLKDRLTVLYSVMDKMENGEIEMDHGLMREIAGLARRVPFLDTDDFQKSFLKEYNDTLLTVHLAAITKGVNTANEILEKSQYLLERPRKKFSPLM